MMLPSMLISTGKVSNREPWRILEVCIGQQPDVLALRLTKELKRLREAAQLLIPMVRDVNGDPQWIVEHVYVRGLNGSLLRIARTPGIDFLRKELAPADWISQLLELEQETQTTRCINDFVRILTGPCARLCGHVSKVSDDSVTVVIDMRTKKVTVHTNSQNTQLVPCLPEYRSFFFQQDLF